MTVPDRDAMLIPLSRGLHAIVDAADYDDLSAFKWHAQKHRNTFCAVRNRPTSGGKRGLIYMHRVVMGEPVGMMIDHINHDALDNRRDNLRICTATGNNRNTCSRQGSTSQYLGVHWNNRLGKWQAQIHFNASTIYIGRYEDEIEAANAYDARADAMFGQHANLNFKKVTCNG